MLKVGKLMEEFSLNFSFANWDEIWKSEVRNFVYSYLHKTKYVVEDEILFVPFIGYLSSKASLIYPDGYKKEFAEEVNSLQKNISKFTLTDFIKISNGAKDIVRKDHSAYIKDEWLNALKRAKGNKAKLRYENETFTSKTRILTTLFEINKELSPENLLKITEYLNSFPKDNKGRIFNSIIGFLPTLRNEVEILSVVSLDKQRKVTMNDFFDIENLIVPLAYSDVLVSRDRWIRSLLKVTDLPEKNNCKYFYDFEGLIKYLSNNYLRN